MANLFEKADPKLLQSKVEKLVIMGGAINTFGNITATAEFNVSFDVKRTFNDLDIGIRYIATLLQLNMYLTII